MSEVIEDAKKSAYEEGLPIVEAPKTGVRVYVSTHEIALRYIFGISRITRFFDGLKEGKIYMTYCKGCGRKYFPPQLDCPYCFNSNVEWIPLKGIGKLITYTVVYVKPPSFAHHKNYIIGLAEMEEGVKVLAWLNVDDLSKIRPYMKVRLMTTRRQPENIVTYEFIPLSEG